MTFLCIGEDALRGLHCKERADLDALKGTETGCSQKFNMYPDAGPSMYEGVVVGPALSRKSVNFFAKSGPLSS